MKKNERVIATINDALTLREYIKNLDLTKPLKVTIELAKKQRGLNANALSHVWYSHIAKETGEIELDIKSECKLDYGIPILRGEDPEWNEFYDTTGLEKLTRERQLKMMKFVPVTSQMSPEQMCRYLNAMQQSYAMNWGIILESKGAYEKWLEKNGYDELTREG